MPHLKICTSCGRTFAWEPRQSRCPECRRTYTAKRNARPQSRFWQSPAWNQTRARVLERGGDRCTRCGSTEKLQAHHVRYDAPLDPDTCVTLCGACHGHESGSNQRAWTAAARLGR